MKGDFCRFCGSKNLKKGKEDIFLESQKKWIKEVSIWICENCGEKFLDDTSHNKLYSKSRIYKREKSSIS
ncbi:MAG: YgiT-type zinc finger protein [bacterium]